MSARVENSQQGFKIDLLGQRFERLMVFKKIRLNGKVFWLCHCDCGGIAQAETTTLRRGNCKSCGCYQIEKTKQKNTKHGKKGCRSYNIWISMKMRCMNENSKDYARYGGLGIKICDKWLNFENFYHDMGDPKTGESIDRINGSLGYFKENCRWATSKQQSRNRKTTTVVEYMGNQYSIFDFWKKFCPDRKPHYSTIQRRVYKGIPIEIAMIPVDKKRQDELEERLRVIEENLCKI